MGQLISVRSNQDFSVNYEDNTLIPQTEIIVLVQKPVYNLNKKGDKIMKSAAVEEVRFTVGTETLNHLIGQLQAAATKAASFDQMAGALNQVIKNSKPSEEEE